MGSEPKNTFNDPVWNKRISKELNGINKTPVPGLTFHRRDQPSNIIDVVMKAEDGTPYEGGEFKLLVTIPLMYPFHPPIVKMVTPIYHPNIDQDGRICLDILKNSPAGSWRAVLSIDNVLNTVRLLLSSPNPDDPLMPLIAYQYLYEKACYEATARAWTTKYAMVGTPVQHPPADRSE